MSERLERAYRRLPGPARSAAASVHGRRLRRWRYGPETDPLVDAALERDTWSADRWQNWIAERHGELERRAGSVPYYRSVGFGADGRRPLLDKEVVRADPTALLSDDADPTAMYEEHTSGSTGTPLRLWWSRTTTRAWYALFEARARRWHGVSRREPWAILGGRLVVPADRTRPPFWVWNAGLDQLYLSSVHLADGRANAYASAIERRAVRHVVGYPSAIGELAAQLVDIGRTVRGVRAVIANAEPVTEQQRTLVRAAFGAPLVETYGMAELAVAASECEAGSRHFWPEVGTIEVIDDELVATGLLNLDMPLIRYRTGDRLTAPPNWAASCPCGRRLPTIEPIDGRVDDVVVTPDGRRLGRLDPIFKADLPLRAAQIVQDRSDHLTVSVVPDTAFDDVARRRLRRRVLDHVGAMEVTISVTDALPKGPAGKVRGVVNRVEGTKP